MTYLLLIITSILLFTGFLGLTMAENRMGKRVLGGLRKAFDTHVRRGMFLVQHVNWSHFLSHLVQGLVARMVHDVAHVSLLLVRFMERRLTSVVRYMRDRRPIMLAPKPSRASIVNQTRAYVKKMLRLPDSHGK